MTPPPPPDRPTDPAYRRDEAAHRRFGILLIALFLGGLAVMGLGLWMGVK